jgi:hypothetical protein
VLSIGSRLSIAITDEAQEVITVVPEKGKQKVAQTTAQKKSVKVQKAATVASTDDDETEDEGKVLRIYTSAEDGRSNCRTQNILNLTSRFLAKTNVLASATSPGHCSIR